MKRLHEAQNTAAVQMAAMDNATTVEFLNVAQSAAVNTMAEAVNLILGDEHASEKTKNEAQRAYLDSVTAITEVGTRNRERLNISPETTAKDNAQWIADVTAFLNQLAQSPDVPGDVATAAQNFVGASPHVDAEATAPGAAWPFPKGRDKRF